ncbi:MAG: hypothetical protein IPI81_09720 [Flavobacteriales bacterium]|nr:hypothetical protein [Flavobacteriales bacterium]MCC6939641.1 hypothetical protein [Flavobacteriales bacterium]
MRFELPDNAREAFQFLALALGAILLLRLAHWGLESGLAPPLTTALSVSIAGLRYGYLIGDHSTWVVGGQDLPGRLALAVLLSLVGGLGGAALGWLVKRGWNPKRWRPVVVGARAGIVVSLVCGFACALFVPPVSVSLSDEGPVLIQRPEFFHTLGLPFAPERTLIPWSTVIAAEVHTDEQVWMVVLQTPDHGFVVAEGTDGLPETARATRFAEALNAAQKAHAHP